MLQLILKTLWGMLLNQVKEIINKKKIIPCHNFLDMINIINYDKKLKYKNIKYNLKLRFDFAFILSYLLLFF